MKFSTSDQMLVFCYIAITSINLMEVSEIFLKAFNLTILLGTSLFLIIMITLEFVSHAKKGERQ